MKKKIEKKLMKKERKLIEKKSKQKREIIVQIKKHKTHNLFTFSTVQSKSPPSK